MIKRNNLLEAGKEIAINTKTCQKKKRKKNEILIAVFKGEQTIRKRNLGFAS